MQNILYIYMVYMLQYITAYEINWFISMFIHFDRYNCDVKITEEVIIHC